MNGVPIKDEVDAIIAQNLALIDLFQSVYFCKLDKDILMNILGLREDSKFIFNKSGFNNPSCLNTTLYLMAVLTNEFERYKIKIDFTDINNLIRNRKFDFKCSGTIEEGKRNYLKYIRHSTSHYNTKFKTLNGRGVAVFECKASGCDIEFSLFTSDVGEIIDELFMLIAKYLNKKYYGNPDGLEGYHGTK